MATVLTFRETYQYAVREDGISIPIELRSGERRIRLFAKVDTGAASCIFKREHGEGLGIQIDTGQPKTFSTANSSFETFGHEVAIQSFGWQNVATVYFARDYEFPRNVLGRDGWIRQFWIRQFRLGLVDYDSTLYLSHYDDP